MRLFTHDDLYDMTREVNNVILVDLDGTLAQQQFPGPPGPPVAATVAAVDRARGNGMRCIVWSSRFNDQYVRRGRLPRGELESFEAWCERYGVHVDGVLSMEKPICKEYWGDECVNVEDL